jgi:CBS domain containing-hemolysin-like protein
MDDADVVRGRGFTTFPGMLRPDELLDRAGITVPEDGPYETVAGFVMSAVGRLPVVGDEVEVEGGTLRVERLDGRRIDRIRFTPTPTPPENDRPVDELAAEVKRRREESRG